MEVEIGGLQTWTESAELEAVLAPLGLASSKKVSTEELVQDDMIAEERCKVAFAAVQVRFYARQQSLIMLGGRFQQISLPLFSEAAVDFSLLCITWLLEACLAVHLNTLIMM